MKSKHIIPIEDQYFQNTCIAYEVCCGFTGKGSRTVKQTVHPADNEGTKKRWSFISRSFVSLHIVLYSLTEEALDNCLKRSQHINNDIQQAENPVQITGCSLSEIIRSTHSYTVQTQRPYTRNNRKCNKYLRTGHALNLVSCCVDL